MKTTANKLSISSQSSFENMSESFESNARESPGSSLTQEQMSKIEVNRKRALDIRKAKESDAKIAKLALKSSEHKRLVDSGAGFYIDEEELVEEKKKEMKIVETPGVPLPNQLLICERCNSKFAHSFFSLNFDLHVCDSCKTDFPDEYKLITKSDAKAEFLLKDCDFDSREPPLKFFHKKNPNRKYGEMKLYLRLQVEKRALEVHESAETLEEKKETKVLNLHKTRQKNYEKKVAALRKEARLGSKKPTEFHKHEYAEEVYDEKEDKYFKICKTCSFKLEYEEL